MQLEPKTREEALYAAIASGSVVDFEPETRKEAFLYALCMRNASGGTGGGGVSSWNDLTDKPFYDEVKVDEVIFELNGVETKYDESQGGSVWAEIPYVWHDFSQNPRYAVLINGEFYNVGCSIDSYTIWLGNKSIAGVSGDTGEPFVITFPKLGEGYGTCALITKLEGVYDVKVFIGTHDQKVLDTKFLPEGYPKYSYPICTLLDNLETSDSYGQLDFLLYDGADYTVIFDGTEYQCKGETYTMDGGYSAVHIGNPTSIGFADNGMPFGIDSFDGVETWWAASVDGAHTISIKGAVETTTPMDEKLIPDTIARKTDVEAAKEQIDMQISEISFTDLKNQPFYDYPSPTKMLIDKTVETKNANYNVDGTYKSDDLGDISHDFNVGGSFAVEFNGESYICECKKHTDYVCYVGNLSLYIGYGEDTGEPFFIMHDNFSINKHLVYLYTRERSTHEVKLFCYEMKPKGLDEKYMPTLTSPNGTKYKLTVADDGTLSAVAVE